MGVFRAGAVLEEARWRSFTFRHAETKVAKATLGNEAGLFAPG